MRIENIHTIKERLHGQQVTDRVSSPYYDDTLSIPDPCFIHTVPMQYQRRMNAFEAKDECSISEG